MELNVTISGLLGLVIALASIGGGLVLYIGGKRVAWRAVGMSAVGLGVGVLLVVIISVPVSKEGEAPDPVIAGVLVAEPDPKSVPLQSIGAPTTQQEPSVPVSTGMMVPRPRSIEDLMTRSHVIVLGTISLVLDEKLIYYGEDGKPVAADEESGLPYTDYEVRIESVLKGDGGVADGGVLVLRMFGHLSQQNDVVTLAPVHLPQPGSHYMLALGLNPDGTYGSGPEGLIYVDGETVAYADGVAFSTELTGEEFVEAVSQKADRNGPPAPNLTHGSPQPPVSSGSPLAPVPTLKFGDVNYVYSGSAEQRRPLGEGTVFVIDRTEINLDFLETVGTTHEGNTEGIQDGLVVYRLKDDGTNDVYTFYRSEDHLNPEDGQIFKGYDEWTRWTAQ